VDGECGLRVDPADRAAFGAAVVDLLKDPRRAEAMGRSARQRVRDEFLGARHLMQYIDIIEAVS
jgi:trehalose synthase